MNWSLRSALLLLYSFLLCNLGQSQEASHLSAGAGAAWSTVINGRTPGTALTPFVYVKSGRHEMFAGVDIYQGTRFGNVLGFQGGYNYYTWFSTKTVRFFVDGTVQFSRFSVGDGPVVPYNFKPADSTQKVYALLRNESFVNVYGAGLDLRLGKRLGFQLAIGGGFNYCISGYTPSNKEQNTLNLYPAGRKIRPVAFGRLQAYVRLWKNTRRESE